MHPAPSVILFTVLSGAGFGYLAFLGMQHGTGWVAFLQFSLAFALAVGGLVASTFHLGNPRRAIRAFTQWRTSWLSREAWASVLTLTCMAVVAFLAVFFGRNLTVLGGVGAALALLTVLATSMIYAQLKTVPRWNSPLTPICFLATALAGGAVLSGMTGLAATVLVVLGGVQIAAWMSGDGRFQQRGHSMATATGLGGDGHIRLFEMPHTGQNYLLNEFVHDVGRRHAVKLRVISIASMCALPALLLLLSSAWPVIALAFVLHMTGAAVSRWLFFAEAKHVVSLYYGRA